MPVVSCPHCSNPVHAPPDWTRTGYTCPHCRKAVRPSPPDDEDDDFTPPPPRPGARRRPADSPFVDFLVFRLMITPVLIQIVFWLVSAWCVYEGVKKIALSFDPPADRFGFERELRDLDRLGDNNKAKAAPKKEFSSALFKEGLVS